MQGKEKVIDEVARHDIEAIALISIAHAISHFFHLVIPSLFPFLMVAFDLSFTEVGLLATGFFVVSAFGQVASGIFADKFGAKRVLFVGLSFLILSSFVVSVSKNYTMLFIASMLAGIGNCVFHPSDYSIINYNISERFLGHAFAWHSVTGNIGWALCPVFMVSIATCLSWQAAAFGACCLAALVTAVILLRHKTFAYDQTHEKRGEKEEKKKEAEPIKTLSFLTIPAVWLCFAFFLFTTIGFSCLQNFGPTIFRASYGLDVHGASLALTSYLVCAGIGSLCGGFLTRNRFLDLDKTVALCVGSGALVACFISSCVLTGFWALPLMGLMGFCIGLANPSRDTLIRSATLNKLSLKSVGRVYGFVYCGMDVGQSISPILFGAIMDAGLASYALFGVAFFQCLSILTVLNVGKTVK